MQLRTRPTLCFGDLFTSILVEEEYVQIDLGDSKLADDESFEEDDDDNVMLIRQNSKFHSPSLANEFELMFQRRSDLLCFSPSKTSLLDVGLDPGHELGLKPTSQALGTNKKPNYLSLVERHTPEVFVSFPSSIDDALSDPEDLEWDLQIVPSSI